MMVASQLRNGMAIRVGGEIFKVISAEYHAGGGKMGGVAHCKLQNLLTGSGREHRFRADERIEEIGLERRNMDFLYSDEDSCYFMDPKTFEQSAVPQAMVGAAEKFLRPGMQVQVEFYQDRAVSIFFPPVVEVQVESTAQPIHQQQDNTYKSAVLENCMGVLVPQFVAPGERIRLEVETGKYVERVRPRAETRARAPSVPMPEDES